jgi:hypothetical protein
MPDLPPTGIASMALVGLCLAASSVFPDRPDGTRPARLIEWSFVAEVVPRAIWWPRPGLAFRPVPEAPEPAATPQARLRQLRAMAEEFSATDDFLGAG